MKKEKLKNLKEKETLETEKISRKEALVKVSKYAAFTAAATLMILSPKSAQAGSTDPPPPGGGDVFGTSPAPAASPTVDPGPDPGPASNTDPNAP